MKRLIFDLETDGLLKECSVLHCLTAIDHDTGEEFYFGPRVPRGFDFMGTPVPEVTLAMLDAPNGTAEEGVKWLMGYDMTVAHNGVGFDYLALEKLYPWYRRADQAWDSLVVAKLVWPYDVLLGPDIAMAARLGLDPKTKMQFIKRHSLKAWGIRLGEAKDDYSGDPRIADPVERKERMWAEANPWMLAYAIQDPRPTRKLWSLIEKRIGWVNPTEGHPVWPERVIEVENRVAAILTRQELDGCKFNREKAQRLAVDLQNTQAAIGDKLVETFGSWWAAGPATRSAIARSVAMPEFPDVTIKRYGKTGKELKPYVGPPKCHYDPDSPFTPVTRTTFNPSSRDHLGERLQTVFGWKPKAFGKNGKPTVDESVLEEIPEAVMPHTTRDLIKDYFVVSKTLGMVANGSKAWLSLVDTHGKRHGTVDRIHGNIDPAGAVTGRGTHRDPNVSQVPAVKKEKVVGEDGSKFERVLRGLAGRYGWECRELFEADPEWEQTGVDASSLELILLGHYLHALDGGAFSGRVCDPSRDPHAENAEVAGVTRADAKTTIYLKIYGGSAYKLSLDPAIIVTEDEVPALLAYKGLSMILRNLAKRFDQDFVDALGDMQKARISKSRQIIKALDEGIAGLKDLMDNVTEAARVKGFLKGLDGRKVHVRKAHAALNALLQSAGAQVCKLWMVLTHDRLIALGLQPGVDFKQNLWVHDELGFTHRPGLGPIIAREAEAAMIEAGQIVGLRGVFRTDAKHGSNWAQTH